MTSFEQELRRRIRIMTLYAVGIGMTIIAAFVLKMFEVGSTGSLDSWDTGILAGLLLGTGITVSSALPGSAEPSAAPRFWKPYILPRKTNATG